MDYKEALEYLLRFADYERLPRSGIVWDLRRMERLLEGLGNPQHAARTEGHGQIDSLPAQLSHRYLKANPRP